MYPGSSGGIDGVARAGRRLLLRGDLCLLGHRCHADVQRGGPRRVAPVPFWVKSIRSASNWPVTARDATVAVAFELISEV